MRKPLTYKEIIERVIDLEGFTPDQVRLKCRKRELVFARQIAMYFSRKLTKVSLARTGSYFNQNHATVLHAIKTVNDLMDTDAEIKGRVKRYEKILRNGTSAGTYRIPFRANVRQLTKFAYRDILSADEIGRYASYMSREAITRAIRRLVIYEKKYLGTI